MTAVPGPRESDDFGPTWFLLRVLPDRVPASIRMRRALKCLLRSFRIKCEGMRDGEPAESEQTPTRSPRPPIPAKYSEPPLNMAEGLWDDSDADT